MGSGGNRTTEFLPPPRSLRCGLAGLSFETTEGECVQESNLTAWRGRKTRADRMAAEIRRPIQTDIEG